MMRGPLITVFLFSAVLVCPLEIAFLLDSSESAQSFRFQQEIDFVRSFSQQVMQMRVSGWHLQTRLAALQYSSSVFVAQNFADWQDLDGFLSRIEAMTYIGQGTYTSYAIGNATELFVKETKEENVRVALLMTDGVDHPRSPDVIQATLEAKNHNIKLFPISLSGSRHSAGLRAMASAQQVLHSLNDPDMQRRLLEELVSHSNDSVLILID